MLELGGGSGSWGTSRERLLVGRRVSSTRGHILRKQRAGSISLLPFLPNHWVRNKEGSSFLTPSLTALTASTGEFLVLVKYMFHK